MNSQHSREPIKHYTNTSTLFKAQQEWVCGAVCPPPQKEVWAFKMAQNVKAFAAKLEDPSSISEDTREEKTKSQTVLSSDLHKFPL